MNKQQFLGWQEVFQFSFIQSMKNKQNIIALVIVSLIVMCSMPVMSMINGKGSDKKPEDFAKEISVYMEEDGLNTLVEETAWQEAFSKWLGESDDYSHMECKLITEKEDADAYQKKLEKSKDKKVLMRIAYVENQVKVTYYYGTKSGIKTTELGIFADSVQAGWKKICAGCAGLSEGQLSLLNTTVNTDVASTADKKEDGDGFGMDEYSLMLAVIMISTMASSIMGESVASSIVTEKSSKVIEYLMTSIRPMAVILGKVLSAVAYVLVMVVCFLVSGAISVVVDSMLFYKNADTGKVALTDNVASIIEMPFMKQVTIPQFVVVIIAILVGVCVFGVIASIFASCVSRVEEMAEGMKMFNTLMVIGAYIAIGFSVYLISGPSNVDVLENVLSLIPVIAPFIAPGLLMIGRISLAVGIISIVLQIVTIVIMLYLVSGIYEMILYHQGNTMKMNDLVELWKMNRKGEK